MFRLITLYFWFTFAYGSKKPNILLIVADDQGLGDIGYTDSLFYSPTIDKLALEGLIMNRMYAATTCSPTRASLLTGKYVNKIGMQDGALVPGENRTLSRKFTLLPEVLRGQGYR
jgi:arylsulfatase B